MYTKIHHSRNGTKSLRYCLGNGHGHNGNNKRNLRISTINMKKPSGNYAAQMSEYWRFGRSNHHNQTRNIIISYSDNELSPHDEADIEIADHIAREFVKKYYPNRQAVIFTQADGKGKKLHTHIIINDVSITDHKGCNKAQCRHSNIKKWSNKIASKYIELDDGKRSRFKRTNKEKEKIENSNELRKHNEELNYKQLRDLLIKTDNYSYKEDMRTIILHARNKTENEADFINLLERFGVTTTKKSSKKKGDYYVFDYAKCPIKVMNTKARSSSLGDDFSPTAIQAYWDNKAKHKPKHEKRTISANTSVSELEEFSENSSPIETITPMELINSICIDKEQLEQILKVTKDLANELRNRSSTQKRTEKRAEQAQSVLDIKHSHKENEKTM